MPAHPLVAEAAVLGVTLDVEDGRLRVDPISGLTPDLRTRIVAAKPELLAALAANDAPDRDPARWDRFKAACYGMGVTPDELRGHFPSAEDREDIVQTPDRDIEPCARTIRDAVMQERRAARVVQLVRALPRAPDATGSVRCAGCRHFEPDGVVGLGWGGCAAGVESSGGTLLHYSAELHPCARFEAIEGADS